jgi:hypothetical protein
VSKHDKKMRLDSGHAIVGAAAGEIAATLCYAVFFLLDTSWNLTARTVSYTEFWLMMSCIPAAIYIAYVVLLPIDRTSSLQLARAMYTALVFACTAGCVVYFGVYDMFTGGIPAMEYPLVLSAGVLMTLFLIQWGFFAVAYDFAVHATAPRGPMLARGLLALAASPLRRALPKAAEYGEAIESAQRGARWSSAARVYPSGIATGNPSELAHR